MNRKQIKQTAVELIKRDGLMNLTRLGLCEAAGIADGSFRHHMGCTFSEFIDELRELKIPNPPTEVNRSRMHPALRKEHILNSAIELAETEGYNNISRDAIAEKAGITGSLVSQYFTMSGLRIELMEQAVNTENLTVIAQGIINKHPRIKFISEALKKKAIKHITS